ncbi:MAG: branched-chain amino acid aminotransferase [Eubacteriaceae bacterium]|nr:branched-chain amino acid aminotransferase [Eubacteriaceae bacterium]
MEIKIVKTVNPKQKTEEDSLIFGVEFTDHMFEMDYTEGVGWHDAVIKPYGPIELMPSAMVLHYAQEVFEGLKAYKTPNGETQLFRPQENFKRMNRSNERMCIPQIDEDFLLKALKALIKIDEDWIPTSTGTSLYLRPFIFATDPFVGVRVSQTYKLMIIMSPVGSYYKGGLAPCKIYVEDEYARTVRGGTGEAKCGGNYAGGLAAQEKVHAKGYEQILWLDGEKRQYIEEVGTSNVFFLIDGVFVTPSLEGTILSGITRKSVIELLKHWGETVVERRITIDEFYELYQQGKVQEAFATGTAAVISPIGTLGWQDKEMTFNHGDIGAYTQKIYDTLYGIQTGHIKDTLNWIVKL